ncbi:DNA helicase, phage-associated; Type III restriction enzme [hydrothermal vent metagenome]|uniref:DNA helicase, phage-associated Type III restriction enzme n=1 Tax=hydrothermal vent metagenome TaxID=652676 RepID=A0A3B1AZQ2_9ZZZZ
MRLKPRPYQKIAVEEVCHRYKQNRRKLLLYLPTGAGKTVIATLIIDKLFKTQADFGRVLFIAHRQEILDQTARILKKQLAGISVAIEQGKRTASKKTKITIASVQSLVKRKEKFDPGEFSLIICDECHRALSPGWTEVIRYFHCHGNPNTLLLGMTATPRRTDGRSAIDVFDEVAFEISRTDLQDLSYLVPIEYYTVDTELGLDKVKMSAGDFQVKALSTVMNFPAVRQLTLKAWMEKGYGKKTIVFCAGVEHAHRIAEDMVSMGVKAVAIDGKTQNRESLLKSFLAGDIDVITNYGVLTEGFDDPGVECILMARPTTSPLVYNQCIGRGLRIAPRKATCVIIDIIDRNTHQLQYGASEFAGLPNNWKSKGRDPFREKKSLEKIKVTSPEAFLLIKRAESLEEVQSILMSLPHDAVIAGLDGEPLVRYDAPEADISISDAEAGVACKRLLKQARARVRNLEVDNNTVIVSFHSAETNNERYAYLMWHLERVSKRKVTYKKAFRRKINPKAILRSMTPATGRLRDFTFDDKTNTVSARITMLSAPEMEQMISDFHDETGMELEIKGQLSLFDEVFAFNEA